MDAGDVAGVGSDGGISRTRYWISSFHWWAFVDKSDIALIYYSGDCAYRSFYYYCIQNGWETSLEMGRWQYLATLGWFVMSASMLLDTVSYLHYLKIKRKMEWQTVTSINVMFVYEQVISVSRNSATRISVIISVRNSFYLWIGYINQCNRAHTTWCSHFYLPPYFSCCHYFLYGV